MPFRSADDPVARARQHKRIAIDGARAGFEFAREAGMQAPEGLQPRIAEIEIGKQPPQPDRRPRHDGILDLAEPAEEPCGEPPRNSVGQQKVDVLLLDDPPEFRPQAHSVTVLSSTEKPLHDESRLSPRAKRGPLRNAKGPSLRSG